MTISISNNLSLQTARLDDWERSLGRFIINFGMIEYLVEVFLKDHLETTEYETVRGWHLNDRVARIRTYLAETCSPQDGQEKFALLVCQLGKFRDLRNHVAHGYLLCRVDPETGTFVVSVSSPRNLDQEYSPQVKHLELEELRLRLQELTELVEAFKVYVGFKP